MNRIVRGGGFWIIQRNMRCALRDWYGSDRQFPNFGFRIAKHESRPQVLRGGSYWTGPGYMYCASHYWVGPNARAGNGGFRIARRKQ